ncbi:unnamed protein product [Urochloa decumbens]|uniref:Uncharacterized protein n=1 Tax=Urochloa decumbens TaxID=240449 RepID=A0ABC8XVW7_9POAL
MPLQKPQRYGAADASSCGGMPPSKHYHRAKGGTASISSGGSQMRRRVETTAGKGALVDEEMTPQKLPRGGEKASAVSRGGGRMPSTTITKAQAKGLKNIESNTSSRNSDVSCRFAQLDINNTRAGPFTDAPHQSTTAQDSRESAIKHCSKEKAAMSLTEGMPKQQGKAVASSGKVQAKEKVPKGSSREMPQKHQAKKVGPSQLQCHQPGTQVRGVSSIGTQVVTKSNKPSPRNSSLRTTGQQLKTASSSGSLNAKTSSLDDNSTVQDCKDSAANVNTVVNATVDNGLQEANSSGSLNAKTSSLDDNSTVQDCKDSAANANTVVNATVDNGLQEANDEIQRLNELGLGYDISSDDFLEYLLQLPTDPVVDTCLKLDDEQMTPLYVSHAHYRFRYLKLSKKESKDLKVALTAMMELIEKECFEELLKKGYFEHFEKDGTLDWSFHPDLCRLKDLDDYQRLVPQNFGGCEYVDWDKYRMNFHSYETEAEYLNYCDELSKKLKWIEDYVLIEVPSLKWGKISTRGAYQAIKIATGFSKITHSLAYTGYYECVQNLRFDAFWFKDLDGVYFEIWRRVTKQNKNFREALEDFYKLEKFQLWQDRMKYALENDYTDMEAEFHTCTASVPSEVTDDKALELIAEAVKKLMERPKFYEHYIRKKIAIARAIGLIPVVQEPSAESGQ